MERGADFKTTAIEWKKKNIPPGSNCIQNKACVNMLLYNVLM